MTKPKKQRLPEPSHTRDCDECDLIAALFAGAVTESEFMNRMSHDYHKDYYDALEIIVQARTRGQSNG